MFNSNALSVFSPAVCSEAVNVKVAPKVEVLKDDTAKLPCTYVVSPPSSNTVVEWYIVSILVDIHSSFYLICLSVCKSLCCLCCSFCVWMFVFIAAVLAVRDDKSQ